MNFGLTFQPRGETILLPKLSVNTDKTQCIDYPIRIIVTDTLYSLLSQQSTCGLLAEEEETEDENKG